MGDLKARLKATFFRRNSLTPSATSSRNSDSRSTHRDDREASRGPPASSSSVRSRSLKAGGPAGSSIHSTGDEEQDRAKADHRTWTHEHELLAEREARQSDRNRRQPLLTSRSEADDIDAAPARDEVPLGGPDAARMGGRLSSALVSDLSPPGNDLHPTTHSSATNLSTLPTATTTTAATDATDRNSHHHPPLSPSAALPSIREHNDATGAQARGAPVTSPLPPLLTSSLFTSTGTAHPAQLEATCM